MPLRRPKVYIILLTVMTLWAEGASGQGHHSGETFVAVRAGANLVGNTYPRTRNETRTWGRRVDWQLSVAAVGGRVRNVDARVEPRVLRSAAH